MAIEDFTTYTETDPNSRITTTASKVSWALLSRDEDAYVYKDKGSGYFSNDFKFNFTHRTTASVASGVRTVGCWAITNIVDDLQGIDAANGDYITVLCGKTIPGAYTLSVWECDGGTIYSGVAAYAIELNTDYYCTVIRDESVGTYGTIYLYIYSDSARKILLNTQTIALHTSKKNFRYLFAVITQDTGTATTTHSGYTENMTVTVPIIGPAETTTRVTGLVHRYSPGNYTLEVFLGDTKTDWDESKPEVSTRPTPTMEPKPPTIPETIVPPPVVPVPTRQPVPQVSTMRTSADISKHIPGMTPTYLEALKYATVRSALNTTPITPTTANILANRNQEVQALETKQAEALGAGITSPALTTIRTNMIINSLGGRIEAERKRLEKAKAAQEAKQKNYFWE
jgi:hypothetical protein